MRPVLLLILTVALASGCTSLRALHTLKVHPRQVELPVSALSADAPISVLQNVRIDMGDGSFSMIGTAEISQDRITLAGLSAVGGRLFVLQYDGTTLTYEPSPVFDAPLRPERILMDFFYMYGRVDALTEGGLSAQQDGKSRMIETKNGEQIVVTYTSPETIWKSEIVYRNAKLRYAIFITPIEEAP